jgi:hypothetical protein
VRVLLGKKYKRENGEESSLEQGKGRATGGREES